MSDELRPDARVLIVRLSALGDVLFALETVAALKQARPDIRIDFLVEDRFAGILKDHPEIDALIVYPRKNKLRLPSFVRRLRRELYDAVIDLHGILKSAVPVRLARSKLRIGYTAPGAREGAHRVYDRAVPLPEPLPHRAARGIYLLRALGVDAQPSRPTLPKPSDEVGAFWRSGDAKARIVIHPGASAFASFKRWPREKFGHLAQSLVAEGHDVAISYGPGEEGLARDVARKAPGSRTLNGRTIGLLGLAATMREADVVIAADTGPLHIAAAAGAKVIALFGPKDPSLYGPRGDGHTVLFHDTPCRPCKRRKCTAPICVRGIEEHDVLLAVRSTLAASNR